MEEVGVRIRDAATDVGNDTSYALACGAVFLRSGANSDAHYCRGSNTEASLRFYTYNITKVKSLYLIG